MIGFGALMGACVGSFIATLVDRWGHGRSILGRSSCEGCGKQLGVAELVPIFSWLVQRGRCLSCNAPIGRRAPLIEAGAALIGAGCYTLTPGAEGALGALFGWQLLALGLFDARYWRLPHAMSALLAATGLLAALMAEPPLLDRVIGGVIGLASLMLVGLIFRLVRKREGLGGGDAPMLGAIGCWLGYAALPMVLLFASGAGLALVVLRSTRGETITATTRLPLGSLMALAAAMWWLIEMVSRST